MTYREAYKKLQSNSLEKKIIFSGEEVYLIDDFIVKLRHALSLQDDTDLNFLLFDAATDEFSRLVDFVRSVPFFSDARLLVVTNAGESKITKDQWNVLSEAADDIYICFVLPGKAKIPSGFEKIDMKKLDRAELEKWIAKRFMLQKKKISTQNILRIIDTVRYGVYGSSTDLLFLTKEIDKLSSTHEEIISKERIEELLGKPLEENIFEIIEQVSKKKAKETFALLKEYKLAGGNLFQIIPLLSRNYYNLYLYKRLSQKGYPLKAMMERTGSRHEFLARKSLAMAQSLDLKTIKKDLSVCLQFEKIMKSETVVASDHIETLLLRLLNE